MTVILTLEDIQNKINELSQKNTYVLSDFDNLDGEITIYFCNRSTMCFADNGSKGIGYTHKCKVKDLTNDFLDHVKVWGSWIVNVYSI